MTLDNICTCTSKKTRIIWMSYAQSYHWKNNASWAHRKTPNFFVERAQSLQKWVLLAPPLAFLLVLTWFSKKLTVLPTAGWSSRQKLIFYLNLFKFEFIWLILLCFFIWFMHALIHSFLHVREGLGHMAWSSLCPNGSSEHITM